MAKTRKKTKWNTRKLVGFIALFLGSLLLCYTDKASGAGTYQFWTWLFGIYVIGNVGTKFGHALNKNFQGNK